jgi:L-arabinose isomerase
MKLLASPEIWFVCGSQHLYGPGPLKQVAANARAVTDALADAKALPLKTRFKALLTTPDEITNVMLAANADTNCAGLILWMHTFSPSKMWIRGLSVLKKPFLHLHTQFNRDLPWSTIDMDFMNLNQAAHGDREAGFIHTRMRLARKVVVGHWSDPEVHARIAAWQRAARAWHDWQGARFVRFGDNMRQVAVTEGDKVASEMKFGFAVNTHGVGDLVAAVDKIAEKDISTLCAEYEKSYAVAPALRKGGARHDELRYSARLELGMGDFLEDGGYKGFTTPSRTCTASPAPGPGHAAPHGHRLRLRRRRRLEDRHARPRHEGHGAGLPGGTSFMEDYTYHLSPKGHQVLGAHMLEICPSIAAGKPVA